VSRSRSDPAAGVSHRPVWLCVWIATVFLSVCWQPFRLGFYLDDWLSIAAAPHHGAPFSYARFAFVNYIDIHRPTLGPIRFLFSSILSDSTVSWHVLLFCTGVLIAYLLGRVATALNAANGDPESGVVYSIAACWMVLPWAIAFRIWPHFFAVQVCLLAFLWAVLLILSGWKRGRAEVVLPSFLYLAACAGYEAFHFQLIPVVLLGALWVRAGKAGKREVVRSGAGLICAEAVALGWYYLAKVLSLWSRKPVQSTWPLGLASNLYHLIPEMLRSLSGVRLAFCAFGLCLAALSGVVLYRALKAAPTRSDVAFTAAQIVCCSIGAGLGLTIHTLAGSGLIAVGVTTRVLSLFSVWLLIAACLAGACIWRNASSGFRRAVFAAAISTGVCLVAGNLLRTREWAEAWRQQQRILREAPDAAMARTASGSTVLYVNPIDVGGAPVLAAPWDINQAMPLCHPGTERLLFVVYDPSRGSLISNGTDLRYQSGLILERNPKNLHVWIPRTGSYYGAIRPFRVNPDFSIADLRVE
jgi:hypothetical protein